MLLVREVLAALSKTRDRAVRLHPQNHIPIYDYQLCQCRPSSEDTFNLLDPPLTITGRRKCLSIRTEAHDVHRGGMFAQCGEVLCSGRVRGDLLARDCCVCGSGCGGDIGVDDPQLCGVISDPSPLKCIESLVAQCLGDMWTVQLHEIPGRLTRTFESPPAVASRYCLPPATTGVLSSLSFFPASSSSVVGKSRLSWASGSGWKSHE